MKNNTLAPEEIAPANVSTSFQPKEENIGEETLEEEDKHTMKPAEDGYPDGNQRSEETTTIGNQRSDNYDVGTSIWFNTPRT